MTDWSNYHTFRCTMNFHALQWHQWLQQNMDQTLDSMMTSSNFPRNWPFVWGIHWSPVNSPHKGQWRGALMFYLICVWINDRVNTREAGDLRRYQGHYDVNVMSQNTSHRLSMRAICGVTLVSTLQKTNCNCFLYACIWHLCFTDGTQ